MDLPLITVVTMTYKKFDQLKQTIDSVLSQDYPNIEYFISDDGSDNFPLDSIEAYIRENKKNNILNYKIIHHKSNLGTVQNANAAYSQASGKFIIPLSADDIFNSSYVITKIVENFNRRNCKVFCSSRIMIDDQGDPIRLLPSFLDRNKISRWKTPQLLPVYDKPMIYYPLSTLMLAGIKDILIISTPEDTPRFEALLKDGSQFGISLSYKVQESPDGLSQAFLLGEKFIGDNACAMVLGDNIFYGNGFRRMLKASVVNAEQNDRATVFGYYVTDPERFGVVEFDQAGHAVSIVEKPKEPRSNYAVTGLYFYPVGVSERAKAVKPSDRGELEITTLNDMYLKDTILDVQLLGRGFAWLDTGTMASLLDAADFVRMIEERQGITISSPEEIGYINNWIDEDALRLAAEKYGKSPYGAHLKAVAEGKVKY